MSTRYRLITLTILFILTAACGRAVPTAMPIPLGTGNVTRALLTCDNLMNGFDSDSLDFEPGDGLEHNRRRLERITPGIHYLICHAARAGDELRAISPDAHAREFERSFYGGDSGRRAFDEAGIRTVGMRTLRDLLRNGSGG